MISKETKQELERQQYRIVGHHSAVKICGWTKNMINGQGGCYKLKFYGIMSNKCLQMSTSLSCANRCLFCWRGYKAPVCKEWTGEIDDPQMIIDKSIEAHHKLLVGFKGSDKIDQKAYQSSQEVKHVALSLTGEPIIYPKFNKIIDLFHQKGISTFLVTNCQYPEEIKNLRPITQLYLSLDAPTKELLKEIDKPLFTDYWERMLKSLQHLKEKKQRTCIRVTVIKDINDSLPKKWAELISLGGPDFIEVKAYMFLGASREHLKRENMPLHEEIVKFSKKIVKHLPDYEIMSEHIPSRVILLAKKKFKQEDGWHTWIDFEKFFKVINSDFVVEDYSSKTPEVGISGKGTIDRMPPDVKERFLKENPLFVDEKTEEMKFYEE